MLKSLCHIILLLAIAASQPVCFDAAASEREHKRILFFAPHPDDEVLGLGGQIWKAQTLEKSGGDYRVILMTNGDAYNQTLNAWIDSGLAKDLNGDGKIDFLDFGAARRLESLAALKVLGVPAEKVIFLGYPDGGLSQLAKSEVYRSPFTGAESVPYSFAYRPGAPFTETSVVDDIKKIVSDFRPSLVYTTTPTDSHPDHIKTHDFVTKALASRKRRIEHREYLVHWEHRVPSWPAVKKLARPQYHRPAAYVSDLRALGMPADLKRKALAEYRTQIAVDGEYLMKFAQSKEVFWNTSTDIVDYLPIKRVRSCRAVF